MGDWSDVPVTNALQVIIALFDPMGETFPDVMPADPTSGVSGLTLNSVNPDPTLLPLLSMIWAYNPEPPVWSWSDDQTTIACVDPKDEHEGCVCLFKVLVWTWNSVPILFPSSSST